MSGAELLAIADSLRELHQHFEDQHAPIIRNVLQTAQELSNSWSGSNLGYHADVYYENLSPRPPGAQFSQEWGPGQRVSRLGSRGKWAEFSRGDVIDEIYRRANNPDISASRSEADSLLSNVEEKRAEITSILAVTLSDTEDPFLRGLEEEAKACTVPDISEIARSLIRGGPLMTRDTLALGQGTRVAPHQHVVADMNAILAPSLCAKQLSDIARRAGSHMTRLERQVKKAEMVGTNVFIGHGGDNAWRILKDFIADRLRLPYDEFNRVPVAGVTNIARLSEMLDSAAIALLVLTAEDERADGEINARMNVIHEVGLFQGRLGFTRAIVLLEEGCAEFSNIQGLGQIRFPKGNIEASFEEIRRVLEREELLST